MRRFSLLILLAIVGCTKPSKGVDQGTTSFYVKSIESERASVHINPKARWQIPESVTFKMRDHGDCAPMISVLDGKPTCTPNVVYKPEDSARALSGELQGASRLIVHDVHINAIPEDESDKWVAMRMEIDMQPRVQTTSAS